MKKADYRITANDADITAMLRKRFIKLTLQDSAGEDSDTVAIELDNRDNLIRLPSTGAELKVWIGEPGALVFKGVYQVDELEEPLDDQALVIHGKAAKMLGGIKAPRDAIFDGITLGVLVAKMATEHGYIAAVSPDLAKHVFSHIDQRAESDMNLLTRLARELGAVAKPVGGRLVVVPKGVAQTVTGAALPTIVMIRRTVAAGSRSKSATTISRWLRIGSTKPSNARCRRSRP
jgi:phage protein D